MDIKDKELHRIAITVIIYTEDGKYLITKRSPSKKAFPNKWTVPGGGLNVDDYINTPKTYSGHPQWYNVLENAMRREVKEEVNIEIGKPWFVIDCTFVRPDAIPVLVLSFAAPYKSEEVKLDEDNVEYAWVGALEAGKYDLIEGIIHEIKTVDDILKNRK